MSQAIQTEAESFQVFLSKELANGGRHKSPEDLLQQWRRDRQQLLESVADVREALENMDRGARGQTVGEVAREIKAHFGWPAEP
jgi:hypothetical protein